MTERSAAGKKRKPAAEGTSKKPSPQHFSSCGDCRAHHAEHRTGLFADLARNVSCTAGKPKTFLLALSIIVVWAVTGPLFHFNDTWQLVINTGTTIITFLMVFLIQNTQNRESIAVQLKLDEIIRSLHGAKNQAIALEELSEDELEEIKRDYLNVAESADETVEDVEEVEKRRSTSARRKRKAS